MIEKSCPFHDSLLHARQNCVLLWGDEISGEDLPGLLEDLRYQLNLPRHELQGWRVQNWKRSVENL